MNIRVKNINLRIKELDTQIQHLEQQLAAMNWERKKYLQFATTDKNQLGDTSTK